MSAGRRQSLGRLGETLAGVYLKNKGYDILERNWRTPYGEIDLVGKVGDTVVFVEVKTRASSALGPPEISITTRKAEHMRNAAEYYIQQHPELESDWRIDLITIIIKSKDSPAIVDHFENVLS